MTSVCFRVANRNNEFFKCRALLDSCSTANFVTENLANKLGLIKRKCSVPVGALNDMTTITKHVFTLTIRSSYNDFEKTLDFLTIPSISNCILSKPVHRECLKLPSNLPLADPEFHVPAPINMLIGSGPTLSLLCKGQINLSKNHEDLFF